VEPLRAALGRRIRQLRQSKGWSQERFADEAGIHRTFAGTLERGENNVSFDSLVKVARCLGVTLSELLRGVEKDAAGAQKD
jgi:transcriptional regulator with XRE-family HTH domain